MCVVGWERGVIVFMMQTFQTSFHAIQREDLNRFNWMTGGGGRGGAAVWQTCLLSLTTHCSRCSAPHLLGRVCVRAGNEGSRSFQCLLGPSPFVESAYYLTSSPFSVIVKLQTSRRLVSSSFDSPISAWKGPPHISYLLIFNNHL